jgi:histone deacetylase 1/2
MDINHIGHFVIHTPSRDLHLKNILHAPQATKNLISVHRLTKDNQTFMEFHPDFFLFKDQVTKKTLLRGRCRGGLYPLQHTSDSRKQVLSAVKPSSSRWHSRLGHPSFEIVRRVISKHNLPCCSEINKATVCDACQLAKSHQLPYAVSTSKSSAPLELIFSDVWGPAIDSFGRKKYYVSFIDDYSKFTWIYLLRYKSEVFKYFQEFQNRKILALQSDWGGEYEKPNSFFRTVGISHFVSCPHTHQQNGPAERKHRHIVEMGLALLANASMPLKYWDQAFLAAVYLINRTPSKVINFDTPMHRLLGKQPDYSSMRIFGCACWPHLRPYNSHKLQYRSKRCVFLGYSNMHKGFKCLDISEGRIYISGDVIFDENIFPFSELHANAGSLLRSEVLLLPDNGDMNPEPNLVDNPSCSPNFVADDAEESVGLQHEIQEPGAPFSPDLTDTNTGTDPVVHVPAPASGSVPDPVSGASTPAPGESAGRSSLAAESRGDTGAAASTSSGSALGSQPRSSAPPNESTTPAAASSGDPVASPQAHEPQPRRTRLQHGIRKPKTYTDGTIRYGCLTATGEPVNLEEALSNTNWKNAMDVEYMALMRNKTWHLVPPEKGKNLIDSKWVWKIKRNADGTIDRYKGRLVAKG